MHRRRMIVGTVVSDKMHKTVVVKIDHKVRHALYKKYVKVSRKFKVHDEKNEAKTGDLVSIVESRPLSREKRWVLRQIVRKGNTVQEVAV
ncbi:MAG: 30S ribosomal protein S17 [Bdellovibrionales bacterium RIFOXYD1_FULL_53_11]|nr:MAG: 30S ribosomal protein S17 [Bdellovibrionales bacterium RIFOXYD1_FULL_53_11]